MISITKYYNHIFILLEIFYLSPIGYSDDDDDDNDNNDNNNNDNNDDNDDDNEIDNKLH